MRAWLIQIDAWNGADPFAVRMASHDDDRLCHLDDKTWWPVIEKLPTLRYDFFDGGFDAGAITSPSGSLEAAIEAIPALPTLAIHDARIRIWGGELGAAFSAFTLTFDGRVKEQPGVSDGSMSINIGSDDSWLDQPLLKSYAGTGAAEGGPDLEGQVKPLALGAPRYVPATLVDAVDNIYQLSGYGPLNAVEMAFERLNRFSAASANTASFAALKAASIDRGKWATCLAGGYVRFGAPVQGMLCFHARGDAQGGWSRLPGDLCRRIADIAGASSRIAAADVTALNVNRPWPLSIYISAQTTARDLIQRVAMSVNAVAYVDWLGVLRLAALGIGTPSATIAADGSSLPPVSEVQQVEISAPYWKIAQGAAVTWQVHGLNDIAFTAPLNPRGPYDPAESYREGDMVTLSNGSQWLFIATTPAKGSAPTDGNANWYRLSEAITAGNITYEDGTPVEDLKPAEPGATEGATPAQVAQIGQLVDDVAAAEQLVTDVQNQVALDLGAMNLSIGDVYDAMDDLAESVQQDISEINTEIAGISPMSTPNLLDNGGFENGLTGWTGGSVWTHVPSSPWGAYIQCQSATGTFVLSRSVSVQANQTYTLSADMAFFANSGAMYVDMIFYNAGGTVLLDAAQTNVPVNTNFSVSDTNRKIYKCTATAPATAVTATCRVVIANPVNLTLAAVRRIKLELGDKATAWSSEASAYTLYQSMFSPAGQIALMAQNVSTQGGAISTQATSITKLDILANNASGNLLTNTDFALDIAGWATGGSMQTGVKWGRNFAGDSWRPIGENVLGIYQDSGVTTGYQEVTQTIAVEAGKYYEFSGLFSTHRCTATIYLQFLDSTDAAVSTPSLNIGDVGAKGPSIADWAERSVKGQAPATAVKARLFFRKFSTTSGASPANSHAMLVRPQFCETTQDASIRPYSVGSSKASVQSVNSSLSILSNLVYASSSPNLLPNGGPENGIVGWSGGNGTLVRNVAAAGGNYLRVTSTAATCWMVSESFNAQAGNIYTLAGDIALQGAGSTASSYCRIVIIWLNGTTEISRAAGASRLGTTGFDISGVARGAYAVTATAPPNTTKACVLIEAVDLTAGATSFLDARQIKMERGTFATPYSGEAAVAQTFTAYSGLSENYASLNTEVNSAGGRVQQALNAGTTNAGALTSLTNTLYAGNPNLFTNGTGERGSLTDWNVGYGTWARASNNLWGSYFYVTSAGSIGAKAYHLRHSATPFSPGYTATASCGIDFYASGVAGSYAYVQIRFLNAAGAELALHNGPNVSVGRAFANDSANRQAIRLTTPAAAPAGTASVDAAVVFVTPDGANLTSAAFRQFKLEQGSVMTGYSGEASLLQAYTVYSGLSGTVAELNTEVNGPSGKVAVLQSQMETANGSISTLKQTVVTGSGNLLSNSEFVAGSQGWDQYAATPTGIAWARDYPSNDWRPINEHTLTIYQANGTSTQAAQYHNNPRQAVEGSKWYEWSVYVAAHRCAIGLRIEWYDGAGTIISSTSIGAQIANNGGTNINNYTRKWIKTQAPSNAAQCHVVMIKEGTTAGQSDSYAWFCRPMLREVTEDFVSPSAYTPSGNRATVETLSQSVNGVLAKAGVRLDVNGYATGWEANNNGSSGDMLIHADYFAILKPGGGARTEYSGGNWRVYDAAGTLRTRMGVW